MGFRGPCLEHLTYVDFPTEASESHTRDLTALDSDASPPPRLCLLVSHMVAATFLPFTCRENYLFVCSCPKCLAQANDPDVTSEEEEEEEEAEGEPEDAELEDEMTDV